MPNLLLPLHPSPYCRPHCHPFIARFPTIPFDFTFYSLKPIFIELESFFIFLKVAFVLFLRFLTMEF